MVRSVLRAMGGRLGLICLAILYATLAAACSGTPSAKQPPTPPAPSFSPASSSSASASSTPGVHYANSCATSQLSLAWGGRISEATGQHTLLLVLTNTSRTGCHLFGYPRISFIDANGRVLPLQNVWGGDQMVTSSPPAMVEIPPAASAYIMTNKYRCDLADYMQAVTARVIPPDDVASLEVSIANNASMDYCGQGDPGSVLYISPVEPTIQAASAH